MTITNLEPAAFAVVVVSEVYAEGKCIYILPVAENVVPSR